MLPLRLPAADAAIQVRAAMAACSVGPLTHTGEGMWGRRQR